MVPQFYIRDEVLCVLALVEFCNAVIRSHSFGQTALGIEIHSGVNISDTEHFKFFKQININIFYG